MTAFAQDVLAVKSKEAPNVSSLLVEVARRTGRSPFSLAFDFFKLRKKRGKLRFYEYFLYELYDRERWSDIEREEFVSSHVHWPLVNACNNSQWQALTEDKWLSACFLEHNRLPVPKTLAVFDRSARQFGGTPKLTNAEDLKSFFSTHGSCSVFAKPIVGMWSAGAMRISGHTDTHVILDGQEPQTYEDFANSTLGEIPYIFQDCLKPHGFFDGITDAIATVRSLNIIDDNQLSVPFTMLKLPLAGNVADNFWRPGNLLCNLNPETGEVKAIASVEDGRRVELSSLPECDRTLIGEKLPFWAELKKLNQEIALLHAENHFGSTDIALTENGPVVVEVNNGCAFELVQIATGKGFLDEKMKEFFSKHNVKF